MKDKRVYFRGKVYLGRTVTEGVLSVVGGRDKDDKEKRVPDPFVLKGEPRYNLLGSRWTRPDEIKVSVCSNT